MRNFPMMVSKTYNDITLDNALVKNVIKKDCDVVMKQRWLQKDKKLETVD